MFVPLSSVPVVVDELLGVRYNVAQVHYRS